MNRASTGRTMANSIAATPDLPLAKRASEARIAETRLSADTDNLLIADRKPRRGDHEQERRLKRGGADDDDRFLRNGRVGTQRGAIGSPTRASALLHNTDRTFGRPVRP